MPRCGQAVAPGKAWGKGKWPAGQRWGTGITHRDVAAGYACGERRSFRLIGCVGSSRVGRLRRPSRPAADGRRSDRWCAFVFPGAGRGCALRRVHHKSSQRAQRGERGEGRGGIGARENIEGVGENCAADGAGVRMGEAMGCGVRGRALLAALRKSSGTRRHERIGRPPPLRVGYWVMHAV